MGERPPVPPPPRILPPSPPKILSESSVGGAAPSFTERPRAPSLDKVPPPPAREVDIRSFESDMSSLKESGGGAPASKTIRLEELKEEAPIFHPETANQLPGMEIEVPSRAGIKKMFKIIGAVVLVIGLGLLGYFVIYPILFPPPSALPAGPQTGGVAVPPPAPVAAAHASLFVVPTSVAKDILLPQVSLLDIIAGLQTEARVSEPAGTLKELAVSDSAGQVNFADYLNALAPQIGANESSLLLENDFTGFLYYDSNGIWPGLVARARAASAELDLLALLSRLEEGDVRLFYVADPGIHSGFKDGPYKGYLARYAKFTAPGASFNAGLINGHVVISSSFDGFKAAVNYLGL